MNANETSNVIDLEHDVILTNRQAAGLLKTHVATIYRWQEEGRLPFWKRGRRRLVRRSDLDALLIPGTPRPTKAVAVHQPTRPQQSRETTEILRRAGFIE